MGKTGVGIVTIITGLLLFIAWLGAWPLCFGFSKDAMNDDGEEGH